MKLLLKMMSLMQSPFLDAVQQMQRVAAHAMYYSCALGSCWSLQSIPALVVDPAYL